MARGLGDDMALICVEALDEVSLERAQRLAQTLHVPIGSTVVENGAAGVKLVVGAGVLALAFLDESRGKPYAVDFLSTAWRARWQQGLPRGHIFRRALGVKDRPIRVVDATAGFGQDSALMAALGCSVVAVERSPVVAALLRDGLERARFEDESFRQQLNLIQVFEGEASQYLESLSPEQAPEVVFLDPMFSKPKKSAKSPKEMQLLQELLPAPSAEDEEKLLQVALKTARDRVVIKRPLKARAIKAAPSHMFKGQSIRYDVYVKS